MMGIYIKGIEMPTKGNPITVLIYPDGTAEWEAQNKAGTAVPVPPHEDLIDRDEAVRDLRMDYAYAAAKIVALQPTIIPAEPPEEKVELAKDTNVPGTYDILYEEGGPDTR